MHYYFGEEEDSEIDCLDRSLRAYEGKQHKSPSPAGQFVKCLVHNKFN